MNNKFVKLIRNPRKYLPQSFRVLQQYVSYLFRNTAFPMQGQMDINPKSRWYNPDFIARTGGYYLYPGEKGRKILDLEPWDTTRRDMLILLLRTLLERRVPGELAELGVYRGSTARLIHHYAPERILHLFDTFTGFAKADLDRERDATGACIDQGYFINTSIEHVREFIAPQNSNVRLHAGNFPASVPDELKQRRFAFVQIDADLYAPIYDGLEFFYPRLSSGAILVVHDYNAWPGARKAVDEYFRDKPEIPLPMPDKSGSVVVVKQAI
jgi:O-methyltransferase